MALSGRSIGKRAALFERTIGGRVELSERGVGIGEARGFV